MNIDSEGFWVSPNHWIGSLLGQLQGEPMGIHPDKNMNNIQQVRVRLRSNLRASKRATSAFTGAEGEIELPGWRGWWQNVMAVGESARSSLGMVQIESRTQGRSFIHGVLAVMLWACDAVSLHSHWTEDGRKLYVVFSRLARWFQVEDVNCLSWSEVVSNGWMGQGPYCITVNIWVSWPHEVVNQCVPESWEIDMGHIPWSSSRCCTSCVSIQLCLRPGIGILSLQCVTIDVWHWMLFVGVSWAGTVRGVINVVTNNSDNQVHTQENEFWLAELLLTTGES